MARSRNFSGFMGQGLRRSHTLDEEDPTSGLANLADCMLVLACGLMVALVVAWNIDITKVTEVTMTDRVQEISDVESVEDALKAGSDTYIDLGRVYQDPETGKLYVVEDNSDDGSGAGTDGSGGQSGATED